MKFLKISQNLTLATVLILGTFAVTMVSVNYWTPVHAEILEAEMSEDGNYITLDSDLSKKIKELTISAWITPDFSEGSSQMTIASRTNAYGFGIDQGDKDGTQLVFTVFDGMRWRTTDSVVELEEVLTHVAATFGESTIDIYLNGNHVATLSDIKNIRLNDRGIPKLTLLESVSSSSADNAGAYVAEKRGQETVSREFGGIIHSIELFDDRYDEQEVKDLFNASFEIQKFSESEEIAPEIPEFDESTVVVSSSTTSTTSLLLSSKTTNDEPEGENSILDDILANFKRIAEKFSSFTGLN